MTYLPTPAIQTVDITTGLSSATRDAFGRLRVSMPTTLFDAKQIYDNLPLLFSDVQTSGSGTASNFNGNQASSTLTVSNLTEGTRVRQSKRRFSYQPGKSQLIDITFMFGTGVAGITKRVGYFDENNGLFLQQIGSTISVVVRSFTTGSVVDTVINQSSWNLDRLDGSGGTTNPSGVTFDPTKVQILSIYFQWLGVGGVTFCLDIGGVIVPIHHVNHSNLFSVVYMSTPNLPIRYEISNNGTGSSATLTTICSSVVSEGGRILTGIDRSVDRGTTSLVTLNDANFYPLVVIRIQSAFKSAQIVPCNISVICTSDSAYLWRLILNPTITGTAPVYSAVTSSMVESAVPTNATTVSGGVVVASGYGQQQNEGGVSFSAIPDLALGFDANNVGDQLTLAVARLAPGNTETFYGSLAYHEDI